MNTDLDEILLNLWNNWMFRLSLSSNELFHSNTLQYLAEILALENENDAQPNCYSEKGITGARIVNPKSITQKAVIELFKITGAKLDSKLDEYSNFTIEREWKHIDLVVLGHKEKTTDPILAIEVKVKSYPTLEQLEEYKKKLDNAPLILLTGMGGNATKNPHFIGFEKLANSLGQQFSNTSNPLALSYIDLCHNLDLLFSILNEKLKTSASMKEAMNLGNKLEPYRLHSIWWKLWASHIENEIAEGIKEEEFHPKYFGSYSGFTKTGNIGTYFKWESKIDDDKREIHIGVQIEGNSFRLFLKIVDAKLGNANQARKHAENILINLSQKYGVFSTNPAIEQYKTYILRGQDSDNQKRTWDIFKEGVFGAPKKAKFRLPGYANSAGDGFADFRLTIKEECSISELVDTVLAVLVNNRYSDARDDSLVLLEVVKSFEQNWAKRIDELKYFKDTI